MSDKSARNDARAGGGIGDDPAPPIAPAAVANRRTDPRDDGHRVTAQDARPNEPDADGVEETEAHPS